MARQVPRLIHTGTPCRRARLMAQPIWSPCSCVMNTASSSSGAKPARASRAVSSRSAKPQSTSTRVEVMPLRASTSSALPLLPLPRLQKRITARQVSFEVVDQEADDALAGLAVLRLALRVQHRHGASLAFALDLHTVLGRAAQLVLLAAEAEQAREEAGLILAGLRRIDIADEVQALRAIAVFHREAAAIERESHAAPCAIEVVVQLQRGGGLAFDEARARGQCGAARGDDGLRLLFLHAQLLHDPLQHLGFQLRVGRTRLPHGGLLAVAAPHLGQPRVRHVDLAAVRPALDARAELVALAARVQWLEHLADRVADDVLRDLGPVL